MENNNQVQDITENNTQKESSFDNQSNSQNDNDSSDQKKSRFVEGEEIELIRVRFPGNAKSQPFLLGKRNFIYAQKVVAMSDRGMSIGYINSFPYKVKFKEEMLPLKTIAKVATEEDIEEQKSYHQKEVEAEKLCLRLIEKHELDMNLTHVEFIQFGKKAVFYFTAPARVDFRSLVKDLVGDLKMRIELRQISVRDRAAALGAIGACGLQTCCSSFLSNYGNAYIKMAKNQNLALIPSKINGVCGQIKCCMRYEDDVYTDKRSILPREYEFIKAANGDIGKVTKLHLILEQFDMLTDKGQLRRYAINQYDPKKCRPPKDWKFPTEFRSIVSETNEVIGLAELQAALQKKAEDKFRGKKIDIYHNDDEGDYEAVALEVDEDDNVIEDIVVKKQYRETKDSEYTDETKPGHKKSKGPRRNNRNRNNNRSRNNRNNNTKNSDGQNYQKRHADKKPNNRQENNDKKGSDNNHSKNNKRPKKWNNRRNKGPNNKSDSTNNDSPKKDS